MTLRNATVTRGPWSVSYTSESGKSGYTLSVFRFTKPNATGKIIYGEANGRWFPTSEAASAYALERGYLQRYVTPWCRHCRQLHTFLGRKSGFCSALKVSTHAPGHYNARTGKVEN